MKDPLKAYAREHGLTMQAVADRAGVSVMTLWRIRHGYSTNTATLARISASTGGEVSIASLLGLQRYPDGAADVHQTA